MKAIILAAGEGVRMRPLTLERPKPLLKIKGRVILEHIVSRLPHSVDELILVVGYLGGHIKSHCGTNFLGRKVSYVHQENKLGTFHALKLCESYVKDKERFLMLYADDIHDREGIENCLKHERSILVAEAEDPRKFGVIKLNKDRSIAEIIEKPENPPSNLVSTGVMVLDANIFKYEADLHSSGEYYLTSALNKMAKDHKIFAVKSTQWIPIGCPEDLLRAEKIL